MKKPKEPKAPVEPIAPSKTIKQYNHIDITSIFERGIKLDQLSYEIDSKIPANINPSDITFRLFSEMVYNGSCEECGGYDSSPMAELVYYKEINNPKYGAQLAKYFIGMKQGYPGLQAGEELLSSFFFNKDFFSP